MTPTANLSAILAFCLAAMLSGSTDAADTSSHPRLVKTITLQDPGAGVTRTFFGEVVAKETVTLGFQVGGRLIELNAPEGEVISAGEVIARLDPVPFEIAVEQARLELEQARRTLSRFERLAGSTISEAQLEDARTAVRLAEVGLRNAQYELDQAVLTAPFDAMVATRNISNFSIVDGGTQIVRLHDLSEFRVDIEVPEVLIQQLSAEPTVTFSGRLPGSESVHTLTFREMHAETAEIGQTFRVTLSFEVIEDRLLLPGASMVVSATLHDMEQGIVVPATSIATDPQGQTSVLRVVERANRLFLERIRVEVDVSPSGDVWVVSGLRPGDEIVAGGVTVLDDGQSIRRFQANF